MDDSPPCSTSASETEAICCSSSSASLGDHNTEGKLRTVSDGNRTNPIDDVKDFPSDGYYIEEEEEDEDEDDFSEEALLSQMGYTKSEPKRSNKEGEEEEEEEEMSVDSFLAQRGYLKNEPPKHEPITTPTAYLNLVSAFKGSREKDGKPHKECRVSWSPEVYDPPCTSDDHFTPSKSERHRSEQKAKGIAGKNRQKSGGKGLAIEGGGKGGKGGKAPGKSKDKKTKKHVSKASKYTAHGKN